MKKFCGKAELWFKENKKDAIFSALVGVLIGVAYTIGYRKAVKDDVAEVEEFVNAGIIKFFNPSNGAEIKTWGELGKITKEVLG